MVIVALRHSRPADIERARRQRNFGDKAAVEPLAVERLHEGLTVRRGAAGQCAALTRLGHGTGSSIYLGSRRPFPEQTLADGPAALDRTNDGQGTRVAVRGVHGSTRRPKQ